MNAQTQEFIPLCVPHIEGNEWAYVKECLDTGWVSSVGSYVDRFEMAFAEYVGSKHAVACSTGTAALHVGLLLAGVKPGDLVLAPTLTFIASINAIRYCNADPVFFDCDEFCNIDLDQVIGFLRQQCVRRDGAIFHRESGRRVAALMPVHVIGNAVNLEPKLGALEEFGLPMVEDAAESLGTRYLASAGPRTGGRHTGTIGLVGCFSFNGNKIITTGGGGMIVTDDPALAKRAKYLTTQAKDDEVRFVHHESGFNYRLTNMQAAMGLAQLERMSQYRARKESIFAGYREGIDGVPGLALVPAPAYSENNFWMATISVDPKSYGEDREQLMKRLGAAAIQARPLWELNHRQRPFEGCLRNPVPKAEARHAQSLSVPCSVGLTRESQARVIQELRRGR